MHHVRYCGLRPPRLRRHHGREQRRSRRTRRHHRRVSVGKLNSSSSRTVACTFMLLYIASAARSCRFSRYSDVVVRSAPSQPQRLPMLHISVVLSMVWFLRYARRDSEPTPALPGQRGVRITLKPKLIDRVLLVFPAAGLVNAIRRQMLRGDARGSRGGWRCGRHSLQCFQRASPQASGTPSLLGMAATGGIETPIFRGSRQTRDPGWAIGSRNSGPTLWAAQSNGHPPETTPSGVRFWVDLLPCMSRSFPYTRVRVAWFTLGVLRGNAPTDGITSVPSVSATASVVRFNFPAIDRSATVFCRSTTWWMRPRCTCSAASGACWPPVSSPRRTTTASPTTATGRGIAAAPSTGEKCILSMPDVLGAP